MKNPTTILTLALIGVTAVAVFRRQTLNELIEGQETDISRRKNHNSSDRSPNSNIAKNSPVFTDLLTGRLEFSDDGRDLALLLGSLPDLSQSKLIDLITTLAKSGGPNPTLRQRIVSTALKLLSSRDPEATLALIPALRKSGNFLPRELDRSGDFAIRQLAAQDPLAAARWFAKNHDGDDPSRIRQAILSAAANHHPALAFDLISELNFDPTELRNAYSAIGAGLTPQSIEQVISTIRDLPPTSQSTILFTFGRSKFTDNFEAASEWFQSSMLTPDQKETILTGITHASISDNPGQWLDLASSHPATMENESNLSIGLGQTIYDWAAADFVAAGEWLNRQENTPLRNQGVVRYIEVVLIREPQVAMEWLATLPTDHSDRTRLATSIHRSLVHDDPDAAATLAETYQLPE